MSALAAPIDPTVLARRFQALSDPTRLAILELLRDGECCVCDLQSALEAAQSRLSFHLRVLKDAGLVSDRKDGRWSYYQLVPHAIDFMHEALDRFTARHSVNSLVHPTPNSAPTPLSQVPTDAVQADGCCG